METTPPLLENFQAFLMEFKATFGETDRRRAVLTKIYSLQQSNCATSTHASEFRQLACDVGWGDQALCDQFCRGLTGDVKNLLLNFLEPTSLNEAITQAVHCDNRLFKLRQEECTTRAIRPQPSSFWPSSSQSPTLPYVPNQVPTTDSPTPMEVDKVGP